MTPSRPQSSGEELANSLTHGLGALLALVVGPVLIVVAARTEDIWRVVATTIYATTLALLYSASSLYHVLRSPRAKKVFQRIDHASIYLLIAGTYTPFTLITLRGPWGWTLFGVVWGLAVLGVAFKGAFGDRLPVMVQHLNDGADTYGKKESNDERGYGAPQRWLRGKQAPIRRVGDRLRQPLDRIRSRGRTRRFGVRHGPVPVWMIP